MLGCQLRGYYKLCVSHCIRDTSLRPSLSCYDASWNFVTDKHTNKHSVHYIKITCRHLEGGRPEFCRQCPWPGDIEKLNIGTKYSWTSVSLKLSVRMSKSSFTRWNSIRKDCHMICRIVYSPFFLNICIILSSIILSSVFLSSREFSALFVCSSCFGRTVMYTRTVPVARISNICFLESHIDLVELE